MSFQTWFKLYCFLYGFLQTSRRKEIEKQQITNSKSTIAWLEDKIFPRLTWGVFWTPRPDFCFEPIILFGCPKANFGALTMRQSHSPSFYFDLKIIASLVIRLGPKSPRSYSLRFSGKYNSKKHILNFALPGSPS